MSMQTQEVEYDVVNGKIVEVPKGHLVSSIEIAVLPNEPKRISAQRRKYILRGADTTVSIAGENSPQIRKTIDIIIDMLEGVIRLGLCKLEYVYTRETGIVLSQPSSKYRDASPVTKITMDIKPIAGNFMIFFELYEATGHKECFTIRSFTPAIENVLTGLRTASQRLAGKK